MQIEKSFELFYHHEMHTMLERIHEKMLSKQYLQTKKIRDLKNHENELISQHLHESKSEITQIYTQIPNQTTDIEPLHLKMITGNDMY